MTETAALHVINPNSSTKVTDGIQQAIAPFARFGVPILCHTLPKGPPAIESQRDADLTVPHMLQLADGLAPSALGYVIACFGDPGLHALRDQTDLPVLGIQEAAISVALTRGQRFGIIAILPGSIPRHLRAVGAMGLHDRLAGDRALGLGVAELADPARSLQAMIDTGRALRDRDGADCVIMGCAGMAHYRETLETALNIPVIEPCQAAVTLALGRIALHQD